MKRNISIAALFLSVVLVYCANATAAEESCITCHKGKNHGLVADWEASKHSKVGVTCESYVFRLGRDSSFCENGLLESKKCENWSDSVRNGRL